MKPKSFKSQETLKIPADQLVIGMHVSKLDRPWLDTPFLFQGFSLDDPDDLMAMRNICEYVYIDVLKSGYLAQSIRSKPLKNVKPKAYEIKAQVEAEIKVAKSIHKSALSEVKSLLNRAGEGEALDTQQVREHVKSCVDSIERNPSAMIWLTRIKHVDQYTAEHCLNVGLLAIALGRHMGLGRKHLELLGLCGMLHDVGKMRLDQAILNKPGKLTRDEFEHIKLHSTHGRDILIEDQSLPNEVIAAAYEHHERQDGNGYPQGLNAEILGFYTKAVTVVDAYDAIVSRRCYSNGETSAAALKIIYNGSGTHFDPKLVVKFIECIGIYPPGCLVEVGTGEVGIVLSVDPDNRLLPKIALLLDAQKRPMQQRVVDLKIQRQTQSDRQLQVKQVLKDGAYGIDLETFTRNNLRINNSTE